jgi:WD40 repeat protein
MNFRNHDEVNYNSNDSNGNGHHSKRCDLVCISTLVPKNDDDLTNVVDASSTNDGTNDNKNQQQLLLISPPSPAWHVSFSRDGLFLATSHASPENFIRIWSCCSCYSDINNKRNEEEEEEYEGYNNNRWSLVCKLSGVQERTIRCTDFGPHHILASASFDGTVCIWEPSPSSEISDSNIIPHYYSGWECTAQLEGHDNEVKSVAWNDAGTLLATCGRDKTVWVWECVWPNNYYRGPTNKVIGTNTGGEVELDCLAVLTGHEADVKFVTFIQKPSYNNNKITTFVEGGGEWLISTGYDNSIKIWEEDDEEGEWYCVSTLLAHTNTVWCVSPYYSFESTTDPTTATTTSDKLELCIVSASHDSSLKIWKHFNPKDLVQQQQIETSTNNESWRCIGTIYQAHEGAAFSVSCTSPSLRLKSPSVASGGEDNCINVYRYEEEPSTTLPYHSITQGDDVKNNQGKGKERAFKRIIRVSNAHEGDVNCVRWHPKDSTLLASAGDDGIVKLWRLVIGSKAGNAAS